jgi:hypothetical protein
MQSVTSGIYTVIIEIVHYSKECKTHLFCYLSKGFLVLKTPGIIRSYFVTVIYAGDDRGEVSVQTFYSGSAAGKTEVSGVILYHMTAGTAPNLIFFKTQLQSKRKYKNIPLWKFF